MRLPWNWLLLPKDKHQKPSRFSHRRKAVQIIFGDKKEDTATSFLLTSQIKEPKRDSFLKEDQVP